jgi:hypothetical protein
MKRRRSTKLVAWCGLLCAFAPRAALAAERACPAMTVESDPALGERWPDLVQRVSGDLLGRDDVDLCAHVSLRLRSDATIGVTVALPDGRSASRTVQHPDDVGPALQALLLIPPHAPAASLPTSGQAAAEKSHPTRTPVRAAARRTPGDPRPTAERQDALGSTSPDSSAGLGIELSVLSGARIGDGQASVALGALSFLDFSGWLLGFEGRVDRYYLLSGGPPEAAIELGVLLGKRLRFPTVTLDVVAGPRVAIKGEISDSEIIAVDMPSARRSEPAESSSGLVPRLLAGARLSFNPRSVFRTFVGVEAAFGPARADDSENPDSTRLPHWTLGLALGASLGTR